MNTLTAVLLFTGGEEMDDILEEAGVKSVSFTEHSVNVWEHFAVLLTVCFFSLHLQKKSQKRKFQDDNLDEDMDVEPQLKYKGN